MREIFHNYTDYSDDPVVIQAHRVNLDDFAVKEDTAKRCVLTNMSSPLGRDEIIEIQPQTIADVYNNKGIDRNMQLPSKRGRAAYVSIREIWSDKDPDDLTQPEFLLPAGCSLKFYITEHPAISQADIDQLIERIYAALKMNSDFIAKILRGCVNPKD